MSQTPPKPAKVKLSTECTRLLRECQARLQDRDQMSWSQSRVIHQALNMLAAELPAGTAPPEAAETAPADAAADRIQ